MNAAPLQTGLKGRTGQTALRLLIVEDENMIALFLEDVLTECGCDVVGIATSVDAALEMIAREGDVLDGAFLDLTLQGSKVFPVATALATGDVPYFFATGYGGEDIPSSFAHIPVLVKPYDVACVKDAVLTLRLASQQAGKQARTQAADKTD